MGKTMTINHVNYEVVKRGTAKAEGMVSRWKHSVAYYGCRGLRDCYERPSSAKWRAYDFCMGLLNDFDYFERDTVIGYNCMQFSYGAYVEYDNVEYVMYITKDHNYLVEL